MQDQTMKRFIYLSIFLGCGTLHAQQKTRHTTSSFPKLEVKKITNLGHGCRLRLRLPNRAELGAHYESEEHPGTGGIGIVGLPTGAYR